MPPDMSDGASTTPTASPRPPRAGRRIAWIVGALAGATVLVLPGLVGWGVGTDAGTAWLLQRLPGVEVVKPRGALFGADLAAERVRISWAGGAGVVEIDGLELRGLRWNFFTAPGLLAQGTADSVTAHRVTVRLPPSTGRPPPLPATLRSPVSLAIAAVRIDEVRAEGIEPLQRLQGTLTVGADGGRQHRIDGLKFDWDRLSASQGTLAIATDAPFDGKAALLARSRNGPVWQAQVSAAGPLARLDLQGALRQIRIEGPIHANNGRFNEALAAEGLGIAREPDFIVGPDVLSGRLKPILCRFEPPPLNVYVVYPSRRHLSAKVRAFADFLVERFAPSQWSLPSPEAPPRPRRNAR